MLWTPRFGPFWFASLLSNIGTWAQQVAEPWLLLRLGASPFLIGLDAFALDAPAWFLTLFGGLLADRGDRRRIVTTFQSIQMLCPVVLVVLMLTGHIQAWVVIAASFVVGITDALSMPSFLSIVPALVEPDQLAAGFALNSTQFNLSRILGPALAGLLMVGVGLTGCFIASAASYVPFLVVAIWLVPRGRPVFTADDDFDRRRPFAGVRDVLRASDARSPLLVVLVTSLFGGPLVTFSSVLVKDTFSGGAAGFSLVIGAFGAGGLLGATALLAITNRDTRRKITSRAALAFGVIVMLASFVPWFWGLPILMVVAGAMMSASNTAANTRLQSDAAPGLRGQTVSLYMLAVHGGASLGSLLTGIAASEIGIRHALLIDGVLAIGLQLAIGRIGGRGPRPAARSQV